MDLAEVILKWELQRIKDDQEQTTTQEVEFSVWCSCSTLKSLSIASKQLKRFYSLLIVPSDFYIAILRENSTEKQKGICHVDFDIFLLYFVAV